LRPGCVTRSPERSASHCGPDEGGPLRPAGGGRPGATRRERVRRSWIVWISQMIEWRLIVTEPVDGATNMAIDEALWLGRQAGDGPPTLRFFAWDPPAVSLGYGQALDDAVSVSAARRLGVGMVRRPTGGSAIYHDGPERELTYSVIATNDDLGVGSDLLEAYRWIALALASGLRALGADVEIIGG